MEVALLVQVASTLFLVGLIWVIQVVHYPLFGRVRRTDFTAYHREHGRRITAVVGPMMLIELAATLVMLFDRPEAIPKLGAWLGAGLLAIVWLSTAFLQVPRHVALARGFDPADHSFLVRSNWVRTLAWTARGCLVLWMLDRVIGAAS